MVFEERARLGLRLSCELSLFLGEIFVY